MALTWGLAGSISAVIVITIITVAILAVVRAILVKIRSERHQQVTICYTPVLQPTGNSIAGKKQPLLPGFKMNVNECYNSRRPISKKSQVRSTVGENATPITEARGSALHLTEDLDAEDTRYSCMYEYVNPL